MYIPLHGYSTYSFLEAIGQPKDIIKRAKQLGFPAIALTDVDVMYGIIKFYQAANAEEIKPIIGVEIGFTMDAYNILNTKSIGSICLLAKNNEGYLNLLKLVSFAGQEGIEIRPKIDLHELEKNGEGIVAFMGGPNSWIAKMLNNAESLDKIKEIFENLRKILGKDNCFLEIIAQDHESHEDVFKINKTVLELSEKLNAECIVSNIYEYILQDDKKTQELAMAIKDNAKLFEPHHRSPTTKNHLMSEDEIREICLKNGYSEEQIQSRFDTTQKIADSCDAKIEMGQSLFPKYQVEEYVENLYEKYKGELIVKEE